MNKIAIPAILVATVMVAGMFAFAPVEQASTVHTTVSSDIIVFTETLTLDAANTDNDTLDLTCNQPFAVLAILFPDGADTADSLFGIDGVNISLDGTAATTAAVLLGANIPDDGVSSEEVLSTLVTDIVLAAPADGEVQLVLLDTNNNAKGLVIDIAVVFQTAASATCDVSQTSN